MNRNLEENCAVDDGGDVNDDDNDDDDDGDYGDDVGDYAGVDDGGYLERNHHVVLQGLRDGVVPARYSSDHQDDEQFKIVIKTVFKLNTYPRRCNTSEALKRW